MFPSESEAQAKLEMLRQRREMLEREIADLMLYLELGRRLPGDPATDASSFSEAAGKTCDKIGHETASGSVSDGRREGRALVAAALALLAEAGHPLHAGEIWGKLSERGFAIAGPDPVAALNTRLWKRSGPQGPLRRLGDAVYALRQAGDA